MTKEKTVVGLDIGTANIRVVVAERGTEEEGPRVIGFGKAPSAGIRKGVVVDVDELVESLSGALDNAEQMTGVPIERATVSLGGTHITADKSQGVIAVSRADGEISEDDVTRVINAAQAISLPSNKEIIHVIPKDFKVDDQEGIKDPVGMNGVRLEVNAYIIEGSTPFIRNLSKCVYRAGVDIESFVLAPLAAGEAVLSKRQKELGTALVDIGGDITGIAVFEDRDLLYTAVLPVGAAHITNDIAIGLRTSIDIAEKVKLEYGIALPSEVSKKEEIDLAELGESEEGNVSRHHVAEIIEARLEEIFKMVDEELKKIERGGLLPGGVVLTGGGAKMPGIVDLAKKSLHLPVQVGFPLELSGMPEKINDPEFATALGLILWEIEEKGYGGSSVSFSVTAAKETVGRIRDWFKKFLP